MRAGIVTISAFTAFMCLLAMTIFFSASTNVVGARDGSPLRVLSVGLAQQSWGFFTKPPSDSEVQALLYTDDHVINPSQFPQSRPGNLFGFKRGHRAQGPEEAWVANHVKNWMKCPQASVEACAQEVAVAQEGTGVELKTYRSEPTLCGTVIVLESEPVRWAFRNYTQETRRPLRAARAEVEC